MFILCSNILQLFLLLVKILIAVIIVIITTTTTTTTTTSSFMTRKLYALALGRCAAESADSPSNQEVLLGGHLYLMVLKVQAIQIL